MAFTSALRPKEFIIDDSNYQQHAGPMSPTVDGRGRVARDWAKMPCGAHPVAQPFDIPIIPRSDWAAMVEEKERTKTRLSDLADAAGQKSLNQGGTNYCWANAVVTAMMLVKATSTPGPHELLSPASVAAQIKNYRNEGGWGGEALEWIAESGIYPQSLWPANAIKREYKTAAGDAEAAKRKITEWYELQNRNFEQLATLCLLNVPVPIGLNWWSHEICACDLVVVSANHFGIRIRNSWGDDYGDHGFAVLSESKATPDDAVAPRVQMLTT